MRIARYLLLVSVCFTCISCRGQLIVERQTRVAGELDALATALQIFRQLTGRLPTTEEGLRVLVEPPANSIPSWRQLMEKVPNDPWGRPYRYVVSPTDPRGYDLYSLGPDPEKRSDDIHLK